MCADKTLQVSFSCDEYRLYGTVHLPATSVRKNDIGIIMINAGPTERAGPNRLYIKMAQYFVSKGFPVFRFDPRGTGESQGYWKDIYEGSPITELYKAILEGIWLEDTNRAIEEFMNLAKVKTVMLYGLCGGAITSLIAGANNPKVSHMCFLGMPVTLTASTGAISDLPEDLIEKDFKLYLKKIFQPRAAWKFLTLQTDYKTLMAVFYLKFKNIIKKFIGRVKVTHNDRLSKYFLKAYCSAIKSGKKMIFVYGENDYLRHEFVNYFYEPNKIREKDNIEYHMISNANHTLAEDRWQKQYCNILSKWIG